MYYLTTETIKKAYDELTGTTLIYPNDILYFLLLKACGINKIEHVSFDLVKENGLVFASRLMSLFTPFEDLPADWHCPRCKQSKDKFNRA